MFAKIYPQYHPPINHVTHIQLLLCAESTLGSKKVHIFKRLLFVVNCIDLEEIFMTAFPETVSYSQRYKEIKFQRMQVKFSHNIVGYCKCSTENEGLLTQNTVITPLSKLPS